MQAIKKITIKSISLRNFKGLTSFEMSPRNLLTFIYGANGTYKTTVATSFVWLLWGKDLHDRKDFEIKTRDKDNNVIHNLEHEVTYVFDIDGESLTVRRVYAEKWQRRRGTEKTEFTGHETALFWNEVPKTMTEYETLVKQTFGNEEIFKCLTNTGYFNDFFNQAQRRQILLSLAGGENDDTEVIKLNDKFPALLERVSGRTFAEYKAIIAKKKKTIKENLDRIPSRLDEIDRMKPEEPDYAEIKSQKEALELTLDKLTKAITDKSQLLELYYQKRSEWVRNCGQLKEQIQKAEIEASNRSQEKQNEVGRKIYELNNIIKNLQTLNTTANGNIELYDDRIKQYEQNLQDLTDQFNNEQNLTFAVNEDSLSCRSCGRPFDGAKRESGILMQRDTFNTQKAKRLNDFRERIQKLQKAITDTKDLIDKEEKTIAENLQRIQTETKQLNELKATPVGITPVQEILKDNTAYHEAKQRLQFLEENPIQEENSSTADLEEEKKEIQRQINDLATKETIKDTIASLTIRSEELVKEQANLNQELATLEKDEFLMEQFETMKSDLLQEKVNRLFTSGMVQFKLFERQLNGGYKDICETLCNGIPFRAANTASQVQAGLEIINVIQQHYGLILPIFMDNAESVTDIPYSPAQIIRLFVSPSHQTLTVQ